MSRFKSQDVEENVACNLIPMIDIMFLLLLFFMLSADMTTRVAEDIKIPRADMIKEDQAAKDDTPTTVINLVGEGENWYVVILGHSFPDWELLKFRLNELAHEDPEDGNPPGTFFTKRAIMLRAESEAPYKAVQRVIQICAKIGYYKIEVVAMKPEIGGPVVTK
jgi:biopolymer transport protein ExbD